MKIKSKDLIEQIVKNQFCYYDKDNRYYRKFYNKLIKLNLYNNGFNFISKYVYSNSCLVLDATHLLKLITTIDKTYKNPILTLDIACDTILKITIDGKRFNALIGNIPNDTYIMKHNLLDEYNKQGYPSIDKYYTLSFKFTQKDTESILNRDEYKDNINLRIDENNEEIFMNNVNITNNLLTKNHAERLTEFYNIKEMFKKYKLNKENQIKIENLISSLITDKDTRYKNYNGVLMHLDIRRGGTLIFEFNDNPPTVIDLERCKKE